ncbi:hypothetical protein SH601_11020 [Gracilibacillus sp. S3-1-1]|uniref:Uncharacterized protein n=1 Tax=Gracilibacillus pellucidus TaxID=3095368 RepID=A0ACC6M6E3_9BACI|nr:hypothetical protein [Gracilibacillus sp. S3-1-1]MDX8046514.1 hypothetical protein [Gracilibacillus sp. S3-1-1]
MFTMNRIEFRQGNHLLFPLVDIEINCGEVKAIQSAVNIREILLQMITGKETVRKGSIQINHHTIHSDKESYLSSLSICWYDEMSKACIRWKRRRRQNLMRRMLRLK